MMSVFPTRQIIRLKQVTSTNEHLLQLSVKEKLPEGTVVIADSQTCGRGLGNNAWESEPNQNLTFSIILYPLSVKASEQFIVSKVLSLAVYDFVSQYIPGVSIKWPNDVYVGDKKIAGMLIENFIEGTYLVKTIAGIGLNINQEHFTSKALNPVSIRQLTGKNYFLDSCFTDLYAHIANRYRMLEGKNAVIYTDYLRRMYRIGRLSRFSSDGKYFNATITGVNRYGMLEMTTLGNERKAFGFKEVVFE